MANKKMFRWLPVTAQVVESDATEEVFSKASQVLEQAGHKEAALSPIGDNGKPRMLLMSAWICHAGKPNKNRDAFTADDLSAAVEAGLFKAPYFGMIDFNHDFQAYGAWYDAEYAYDEQAGAFGVVAKGALFAWRYEEMADRILAMQQRLGVVNFSMACIARNYETASDEKGSYTVLRNPVFFTTSALDVDPADPHGRGLVTENLEAKAEIESKILAHLDEQVLALANNQEEEMDEKMIEAIKEVLGDNFEQYKESFAAAFAAVERIPALEAEVTALKAEKETVTASVTELTAKVETLETEKSELQVVVDSTKAELETVKAEKAELQALKDEIDANKAAEELVAKRTARLESLNEAAKAAVEAKPEDEKNRLLDMWVAMADEDWAQHIEVMNIAKPTRETLKEKSEKEGHIGGGSGSNAGKFKIDQFFN